MKLAIRPDKKRNQALDAVASVAKTWSEWRLGERASKTVSKNAKKTAKKAKKASGRASSSPVAKVVSGTPLKVAGLVALAGGVGAAVTKKLKGSGPAEPVYTPPPPPPAPFDPPAVLADVPSPPPTPVEVGDLAPAEDITPAGADESAPTEAPAEPEADAKAEAEAKLKAGAEAEPAAEAEAEADADASESEADDETKAEKSSS